MVLFYLNDDHDPEQKAKPRTEEALLKLAKVAKRSMNHLQA